MAKGAGLADTSLWLSEVYGTSQCESINSSDLENVENTISPNQCQVQNNYLKTIPENFANITESIFFNEQARQQVEETECEISKLEKIQSDPEFIEQIAKDIKTKIPLIKEQIQKANESYLQFQKFEKTKDSCFYPSTQNRQHCVEFIKKLNVDEKKVADEWLQKNSIAEATLNSLWQSQSSEMNEYLEKLINSDKEPSIDKIIKSLSLRIPKIKKEYQKNKEELINQSSKINGRYIYNDLSNKTKRTLFENALNNGFFSKTNDKDLTKSKLKLQCQLEGKYTKGRDQLDLTLNVASFAIGGTLSLGGKLLAKMPVAFKSNRWGRALTKAKGNSPVLNSAVLGLDGIVLTDAVNESCFSSKIQLITKNSCPQKINDIKEHELKKVEQGNCILDVALGVSAAGIGLSKSARILHNEIQLNKVQKNHFAEHSLEGPFYQGWDETIEDLMNKTKLNQNDFNNVMTNKFKQADIPLVKMNDQGLVEVLAKTSDCVPPGEFSTTRFCNVLIAKYCAKGCSKPVKISEAEEDQKRWQSALGMMTDELENLKNNKQREKLKASLEYTIGESKVSYYQKQIEELNVAVKSGEASAETLEAIKKMEERLKKYQEFTYSGKNNGGEILSIDLQSTFNSRFEKTTHLWSEEAMNRFMNDQIPKDFSIQKIPENWAPVAADKESSSQGLIYLVNQEMQGARYQVNVTVCNQPNCILNSQKVSFGDILSITPMCGPDVYIVPPLINLLGSKSSTSLQRSQVSKLQPCVKANP